MKYEVNVLLNLFSIIRASQCTTHSISTEGALKYVDLYRCVEF